jgi:hypothetical protein
MVHAAGLDAARLVQYHEAAGTLDALTVAPGSRRPIGYGPHSTTFAVESVPREAIVLAHRGIDNGGEAAMLKTYRGSCHCGAVKFEADLDLEQPTYRCNCSICRRTRFWPAVAKPEGFRLLAGEGDLTRYVFNTRKNHHYFCKHCGVRAFGVGNDTPVGKMYGVNVGCLEDVTDEALSRLAITYVDGRNDRWQSAPEFFGHL